VGAADPLDLAKGKLSSVSGATLRYFFSAIKSSFARANKPISRLDVLAITHAPPTTWVELPRFWRISGRASCG
jgi:hypothetical protein